MQGATIILALVSFGTVIAAVAERLSAPAPSLLVAAGLLVALVSGLP